jgi:hypothetical protein
MGVGVGERARRRLGELRRRRGSRGAILGTIDRLRSARRFDEAIETLTVAYRESGDPELAVELLNLRHEAFMATPHPVGRDSWPPRAPDLFGPVDGLVEVDREGFDVDVLTSAIVHHGSLVVRRLLPADQIDVLNRHIDRTYDYFAGAERAADGWYRPFVGYPSSGLGALDRSFEPNGRATFAADVPEAFVDVVAVARQSGALDVIETYLGEPPALSVLKTTLRKVAPDSGAAWHQDGAFLGRDIRSLNMWIALSDCGIDAPTLDMVARRLTDIVETGTAGSPFTWSVGDAVAERAADGSPIVRPIFRAGDAIFFDHLNLHRTGVGPGMTRERSALEAWFFAPSTFPLDQVPLVV